MFNHKPRPHQPAPPRQHPSSPRTDPSTFAAAVEQLLASMEIHAPSRRVTPFDEAPILELPRDYREQADGSPYEDAA